MGKLLNKDLCRSVYNNYLVRFFQMGDSHNSSNAPKSTVNHTPFPRMADFSQNRAKNHTLFAPIGQIRRQSQCRDVTFAGPKKTTNLLRATTSLPHAGVGNRIQTAAFAREDPCANYDLKDRMSPNYERSGTVHCFLGNILISKSKRGNFHTTHHSKWNNNMKESLHDCSRHPWCVRQLPYMSQNKILVGCVEA